jgi:hypothetical protein
LQAKPAHELLRNALGQDAEFHPGQLEAIVALVQEHARVLVVEPTGWGKSVVYLAEMLQNHWELDVMPTWVTAVPSRRAPELVRGFAERLAYRLELPYRQALGKTTDTPPRT